MSQPPRPNSSRPPRRGSELKPTGATAIVRRRLKVDLKITRDRKLYGGSIHRVMEWFTDGQPTSIVAKMNRADLAGAFRREMASLQLFRKKSALPVPEPWAVIHDEPEFDGSGLLMEKIPGITLTDARLSPKGVLLFQQQLAQHVIKLHSHHRSTYGSAHETTGTKRWLDNFQPSMQSEFDQVRDLLATPTRLFIDDLLRKLDAWIPETNHPTLAHGDLWANNILIDDAHPDRPRILAFIDPNATYCDPEYELAYLRLFRTAQDPFFELYRQHHTIHPGFRRRARIYWLNTMLMHVRVFGQKYVPACEDLVTQLKSL